MTQIITLDAIKAEQAKVAEMIATFEAQAKAEAAYPITLQFPELKPGERYLGAVISACGTKRHHTILLPGDADPASWQEQMDWAEALGGDLPDRIEQAMLLAMMKDQFKEAAYWSNEKHVSGSGYAWYQYFINGYQTYDTTDGKLRARAVRRLAIQ